MARDILAPEVADGVRTAEEVDALAGHKQRRTYLKAAAHRRDRRRRKHLLAGVLDLCTDLADADGASTTDVVASRADLARVRGEAASPPAVSAGLSHRSAPQFPTHHPTWTQEANGSPYHNSLSPATKENDFEQKSS
jgi:hypothetical protein